MSEKKDCKIVQDLLPNYIEKLTTKETNNYIEEHVKDCVECKKILKIMERGAKNNEQKNNNIEINYIKKYSKKMKMLKTILFIILITFVVIIGRRATIILFLSNKAKNNASIENYYIKSRQYEGDSITVMETHHKNDKQLSTLKNWTNRGDENKIIEYKNGDVVNAYIETNGEKIALLNVKQMGLFPLISATECMQVRNLWELLVNSVICPIKSTKCNGKDCYYFSNWYSSIMFENEGGTSLFIEKSTGLPVRTSGGTTTVKNEKIDIIIDYDFEFDVVKDDEIKEPDITQYKIQ